MGVYIKGMEMPEYCAKCNFIRYDQVEKCYCCGITKELIRVIQNKRKDDCPLVEVPPHGRLIDADALLNLLNHCMFPSDMVTTTALSMATNWIKEAPTVIEAEDSDLS